MTLRNPAALRQAEHKRADAENDMTRAQTSEVNAKAALAQAIKRQEQLIQELSARTAERDDATRRAQQFEAAAKEREGTIRQQSQHVGELEQELSRRRQRVAELEAALSEARSEHQTTNRRLTSSEQTQVARWPHWPLLLLLLAAAAPPPAPSDKAAPDITGENSRWW